MSDYLAMQAQQRAEVLGSLTSYLRTARVKWAVAGLVLDDSTDDAIKGALAMADRQVERLGPSGELGQAATAGTLAHARWMAIARTTWDGVAAQMEIMGSSMPSFSRVWNEVVVPTGETIAHAAEEAASATPYVLVLAVVALVAIAVIKVT